MSSTVIAQQPDHIAAARPSRTPRPRIWAVVGVVVGIPLGYAGLSVVESLTSRSDVPPAGWPVVGTVVIGVLAVVVLVAVLLRRWRLAVLLSSLLALPWVVLALTFAIAFGLGVVLLPPALPWIAVLVSAMRSLSKGEAAARRPTVAERERRARLWAALLLGLVAAVSGAAVRGRQSMGQASSDGIAGQGLVVTWGALGLALAAAAALLALALTSRWRATWALALGLAVGLLGVMLVLSILGLGSLALMSIPAFLVMHHAQRILDLDAANGATTTSYAAAPVDQPVEFEAR